MVNAKGGWGLLTRFEARALLGFEDKVPALQEGEWGSGKLAPNLIKAGREGKSSEVLDLLPVSYLLLSAEGIQKASLRGRIWTHH